MLSVHVYFPKYLHKIGKTNSPICIYDDSSFDDAEHTIFESERWGRESYALEQKIGHTSSENIISIMLCSRKYRIYVAVFVEIFLRVKQQDLHEYYTLQ